MFRRQAEQLRGCASVVQHLAGISAGRLLHLLVCGDAVALKIDNRGAPGEPSAIPLDHETVKTTAYELLLSAGFHEQVERRLSPNFRSPCSSEDWLGKRALDVAVFQAHSELSLDIAQ